MQKPMRWLTTDDENTDSSDTPVGQRLVRLTDDDVLVVFRLCLQEQAAFGHQTDKMLWRLISRRLFKSRGKEHKTLQRVVAKAVRDRREFLALLPSGEHDNQSSMTDALDSWIAVQDARLEVQKARLDAQGTANAETTASSAWRQSSLALWTDKTQLLRVASRAFQREEDGEASSPPLTTPDPRTSDSTTPPPTTHHPHVSQRRRRHATSTAPSMPLDVGDPIAIGLERLISVVETVASRIGGPQREEGREELHAVVKRRLEDLESKISAIDQNVATMLV
ncbi:hypothetical protein VC83_00283 [Pseudogymnoascus destructans]|nr:uncharacterized protein VC83_00283 [Pseudogymnoascus destructans]OAF63033.2 hypothetical protein VC83_00283 [Pseudogymnoascus destructans]